MFIIYSKIINLYKKQFVLIIYGHFIVFKQISLQVYINLDMIINQQRHYCEQGNAHQNKSIVMICLNADCEQRRLCCLVCIDQFHSKHELMSLQKFKSMLEAVTQQINPDIKTVILHSIKQLQSFLVQRVDQIVEQFRNIAARSKDQIKSAISSIEQSVNFSLKNTQEKDIFYDLNNNKANQYLKIINQAKTFSFKDIVNSQIAVKSAMLIFERGALECEKFSQKAFEQLNRQIKKIKDLTKSKGVLKNRCFSKKYKSADISINEACSEAIRTVGIGGFPIALIDEPINDVNNTINVLIKEQPGNKGIWMGVCVLNIVENHNFAGCYGLGKGTWAIDQVGIHTQSAISWSHHDSNYNSNPKVGWKPQTGDKIVIKVDFAKSTVLFTCGPNSYEMPIQLNLGDLYFFVGVTNPNDKLCIV